MERVLFLIILILLIVIEASLNAIQGNKGKQQIIKKGYEEMFQKRNGLS